MSHLLLSAIVLFSIVAIVSVKTEKSLFNPLTVFCAEWAVVILLSATNKKLYISSSETYNYIIIGVVLFIVGYYFRTRIFRLRFIFSKTHHERRQRYNVEHIPRYKLLKILLLVCIVIYAKDVLLVISHVGLFQLGTLQKMLQSGALVISRSPVESFLVLFLVEPLAFSMPAIVSADIWVGRRDKTLIFLTITLLLARMLSTANRSGFILFFIFIIISGGIILNQNGRVLERIVKRSRKYKFRIIGVGVILALAFAVMTVARGSSLFQNITMNFAIPPQMFEIWRGEVDKLDLYSYGSASLMGICFPITYVLGNILHMFYPSTILQTYNLINLTDTQWVWPGRKITANAYISVFWFLYTDFRLPGIIIGMFIYGCIAASLYNKALIQKDARHISLYCVIFFTILYSFVRMQFSQSRVILGMLFIAFVAYQKKYSLKEEANKNENSFR